MREWLLDDESLTRRLQDRWGTRFAVQVTGHAWRRPALEEARLLNMPIGSLALIREVRLCDGDVAYVHARTVMPPSTLTGPLRRLATLGSRPLGAAIFAEPSLQRLRLELARVTPGNPLFPGLTASAWGRRSLFSLAGRELLVYEVFLPEFFHEPAVPITLTAEAA